MSTLAEARLVASDINTMPLPTESRPGLWVDGGWPTATGCTVSRIGDRTVTVWEITEGVVSDIESEEQILVLSGSGYIRFEDGERVELHPHVLIGLRAGERTEWTVTTTIRALLVTGPSGPAV